MADELPQNFIGAARLRLRSEWKSIQPTSSIEDEPSDLPEEIRAAIRNSVNSPTKTYRYVLPTQLLAKSVDPELDARCVQVASGLTRAFDARSLCHTVIVDFDREHDHVLGGSASPYLSNPLRIPALTSDHRGQQKNKDGYDALVAVLAFAQAYPDRTEQLFRMTLREIHDRLSVARVVYAVPNRTSLKQCLDLLSRFLAERTGGVRKQAVAVALFECIGRTFGFFNTVRSANINAADLSTGIAADLECLDSTGRIVMAVEVKDRQLTLHDAQDKLPAVRDKGIGELLFLVQGGVENSSAIDDLAVRQFVTGQNLYVLEFDGFLESCLVLFREDGRREFLRKVGQELDERRIDIAHRRKWAELLAEI